MHQYLKHLLLLRWRKLQALLPQAQHQLFWLLTGSRAQPAQRAIPSAAECLLAGGG
jgi:hypothetical protein